LPRFSVARLAKEDLKKIALYTLERWGEDQMRKYDRLLREGIGLLAENKQLGRVCASLSPGLRRFEVEKHVVFYLPKPDGILVVRVLHGSMLPQAEYFEG